MSRLGQVLDTWALMIARSRRSSLPDWLLASTTADQTLCSSPTLAQRPGPAPPAAVSRTTHRSHAPVRFLVSPPAYFPVQDSPPVLLSSSSPSSGKHLVILRSLLAQLLAASQGAALVYSGNSQDATQPFVTAQKVILRMGTSPSPCALPAPFKTATSGLISRKSGVSHTCEILWLQVRRASLLPAQPVTIRLSERS